MSSVTFLSLTPALMLVSGAWAIISAAKPRKKAVTALGFFLGFASIAAGVLTVIRGGDPITEIALILVGLALFLKPIKNVRWASLFGFIIGAMSILIVKNLFSFQSPFVYLGIFFISAFLAYLAFKFAEDLLSFLGTLLSFPPVLLLLGALTFLQGVLILLGKSLIFILH